jgi:hypothetical protein
MIYISQIKKKHANIKKKRESNNKTAFALHLPYINLPKEYKLHLFIFLLLSLVFMFLLNNANAQSTLSTQADVKKPNLITNFKKE